MNKKSGSTPTSKAENMPKSVPGAQTLRRRAEALALRDLNVPEPGASSLSTSAASLRQTMHELRVHQIELEMQNEELRRKQVELDLSRARYFDLYDLAPVAYCSVSQKGLIVQANLRAATQLGLARSALLGQRFSAFIHRDAQDHFYRLKKQLLDSAEPQSGELELVQRDGTPFWALLQISAGQDASGAALLLVVLSDLSELLGPLRAALGKWLPEAPAFAPESAQPPSAPTEDIIGRIAALAQEVLPLLAANKFDGITRFKALQEAAAGTKLAPAIHEIGLQLQHFRFDLALERLRRMATEHEWELET